MSASALTMPEKPGAALMAPGRAWFCVRAQHKHEQLAATCLRQLDDVEVFNPLIQFPRLNHRKKIWITEALFPCYLFARFDWHDSLSKVHYAPGVLGVVHFGCGWPTVPDKIIEEIRAATGPDEIRVVSDQVQPGDEVEILDELFAGFKAIVTQVLPGRKRVAVLLDFLGRQTMVEVSTHSIIRHMRRR